MSPSLAGAGTNAAQGRTEDAHSGTQQQHQRPFKRVKPSVKSAVPVPFGPRTAPFSTVYELPVATEGRYATHTLHVTYTNIPEIVDAFIERHADVKHYGFDLEHRPTFKPGQKANISMLQIAPLTHPADSEPDTSETETETGTVSLTPQTHPVLLYSLFHNGGVMPTTLDALLHSPTIFKYGVGVHGDLAKLRYTEYTHAATQTFIDLSPLAVRAARADATATATATTTTTTIASATDGSIDDSNGGGGGGGAIGSRKGAGTGLKSLIASLMGGDVCAYKTKQLTMTNWETVKLTRAQVRYAALDAFCSVEIWRLLKLKVRDEERERQRKHQLHVPRVQRDRQEEQQQGQQQQQ